MTLLHNELSNLAEEICSAREDVIFSDTLALSPGIAQKERAARIKSLALIQLASCFEKFLSSCIEKTNTEISAMGIKSNILKPSLLTLAFNDTLLSIKNSEGEK